MLSLGAQATTARRVAFGSFAAGGLLLWIAGHGTRYLGLPPESVEYPAWPGLAGSYALAFGGAVLLALLVTGNLPRANARCLLLAAGLFAAPILVELISPGLDRYGLFGSIAAAVAFSILLWPEGRAVRASAAVASLVEVAAHAAFALAPKTYASDGTPIGPGIAWLHGPGNVLLVAAPLLVAFSFAVALVAGRAPRASGS